MSYLLLIWVGEICVSHYCEILCTCWWALDESTMELETMDAKPRALLEAPATRLWENLLRSTKPFWFCNFLSVCICVCLLYLEKIPDLCCRWLGTNLKNLGECLKAMTCGNASRSAEVCRLFQSFPGMPCQQYHLIGRKTIFT